MKNEKKSGQGFGIASLALGVISLLLFCTCVNWITAVPAIIFGVIQIAKNREWGFAAAGMITAAVSIMFAVILYIAIFVGAVQSGSYDEDLYQDDYYGNDYEEFYEDYLNEYDGGYGDGCSGDGGHEFL